jgi:hypothetical protein
MKVNAPKGEDLIGGSGRLDAPGWFHFLVTVIHAGAGPKGTPIDGFTAEVKVLGGLADDKSEQKDKEIKFTFFAPDMSKDVKLQEMNERANTAFFVATNLIKPEQLGAELEVNEELATGSQFVAHCVRGRKKDANGKYQADPTASIEINFSDIFHVDDPAVAKIQKNADAIALIEPKDRHKPEWFDFKKPKNEQAKSKAKSKDYDDDVLAGVV